MTDIRTRLAAAIAAPKTHASVIKFSDGSERRTPHQSEAVAHLSLRSYIPLIGKHTYISRETGLGKQIVSCEVVAL